MIDRKQEDELVAKAIEALAKAYCPYSDFAVGCALLDDKGNIHVGVNVENASYPVGTCAEAGAIAAMATAGGKKISAIAVACKSKTDIATPCGACRQRINEFGDKGTPILSCNEQGLQEKFTLGELLPNAFGPENLT